MLLKKCKLILVSTIILYSSTILAQDIVYNKSGEVFERKYPSAQSQVLGTYQNFSFISIYDAECGFDYEESEQHKKLTRDCERYKDSCENWFFTGAGYISKSDIYSIPYNMVELQEKEIDEFISEFRKDSTIIRVTKIPFDSTKHKIDFAKKEINGHYPLGGFNPEPKYEFKEVEVIYNSKNSKQTFIGLFDFYVEAYAGNFSDLYITLSVGDGAESYRITWVFVDGEYNDYTIQTAC